MRTVIIYARVSTLQQAAEGVSLDAQVAKLRAWATANGHAVGGVYQDALSGTSADDRPGLQQALDRVCAERGIIAVSTIARLARSTRDCLEIVQRLDDAGAGLVAVGDGIDTASGGVYSRFLLTMLVGLATLEASVLAERTASGMAHLRSQGRRISGKIPFGHDLGANGILTPNSAEQAAIAAMRQWRAEGAAWAAIASKLTLAGTPSKYGKMWRGDAVRQVVERAERDERERQPARTAG